MKMTRRQLVAGAAGAMGAVQAAAQSSPAAAVPANPAGAARANVQRNAETLAKFDIPISTEPAFQFKA